MEMNLMYRGMASPVSGCHTCQSSGMGWPSFGDVTGGIGQIIGLASEGATAWNNITAGDREMKKFEIQSEMLKAQNEANRQQAEDRRREADREHQRQMKELDVRQAEANRANQQAAPQPPTPDAGNKKLLIYGGIGAVVLTGIVVAVALISKKKK